MICLLPSVNGSTRKMAFLRLDTAYHMHMPGFILMLRIGASSSCSLAQEFHTPRCQRQRQVLYKKVNVEAHANHTHHPGDVLSILSYAVKTPGSAIEIIPLPYPQSILGIVSKAVPLAPPKITSMLHTSLHRIENDYEHRSPHCRRVR